jgi:hypothetical protein
MRLLRAGSVRALRVKVGGASSGRKFRPPVGLLEEKGPRFAWTTAGGKEPAEATYPPGPPIMLSWKDPNNSTLLRLGTREARDILEVQVSNAPFQTSLLAFLGRTSYAAEVRDDGVLVIEPPGALEPEVARAELRVYLRMWERLTPGGAARLVGET